MSGLLAANMLRRFTPTVLEAQPSLPHNHHALLRFRSDICSRATGIRFKEVTVRKAVKWRGELLSEGNLAVNNSYSRKVTGKVLDRSIINLETSTRYIAPPDFIQQMAKSVNVQFNEKVSEPDLIDRDEHSEPILSTMPMPILMKLLGWQEIPEFTSRRVWAIGATIRDCDVYQTIYYPGAEPNYRASITGDKLVIECTEEPPFVTDVIQEVAEDFGFCTRDITGEISSKEQQYGKIRPLSDPNIARRFVLWATDKFRIYSLGRFALWRNILQDDVCKDIGVIERLIEFRDDYRRQIQGTK